MLQGLAVQELHDDERLALVFTNLMDGADIRMVEGRRSTRLTLEALERRPVARHVLRQELQGDSTAELGVFGLVDHAHSAATELLQDAVVRNDLADHTKSSSVLRSSKTDKSSFRASPYYGRRLPV